MACDIPVYTVSDESRYLIVKNVPALGCTEELVKLFGSYGPIEEYRIMDEEESEPFTDIYWIKFVKIANARFAKRKLDKFNFFGNLLQVTYAPTYETLSDTKDKLEERQYVILSRIRSEKHRHAGRTIYSAQKANQEHQPLPSSQRLPQNVGSSFTAVNMFEQNLQLDYGRALTNPQEGIQQPTKEVTGSMNATVLAVRQKLNEISSIGSQTSECHGGNTSSAKHSQMEKTPTEKKARIDNRRRI